MARFAEELDLFLIDLDRVARSLSYDIEFSRTLSSGPEDFETQQAFLRQEERIDQRVNEAIAQEPRIQGYFLHTPAGYTYSSYSSSSDESRLSPLEPEWYQAFVASPPNTHLFRWPDLYPEEGRGGGRLGFATVIPVFDLTRKLVDNAVLVFLVRTEEIDQLAEPHRHSTDNLFLFETDGDLIFASNPQITFKTLPTALRSELARHSSGRARTEAHGDRNSLVSFMTSRFGTVKLLAFSSAARVDDSIYVLTRYTLFFLLGLVILLALFVLYISRAISSPISHLETAVDELEASQFSAPAVAGPAKRGLLFEHFDHVFRLLDDMVERINDYHHRQKEQELLILQSQINPHFVYNTLNTIRVMADMKGEEELADATRSLIHLLKSSIRIGQAFIPIREEVSQIKDYVSLQSLRYEHSFDVDYQIDADVMPYTTIKFALQPIVENAIFHGLNGQEHRGRIVIEIRKRCDRVDYAVADNGKGIDGESARQALGDDSAVRSNGRIGLRNVNARLIEHFGDESRLVIAGGLGVGTIVRYSIPAVRHEEDQE